jgi:type IV pilus assembly protein PilA
MSAKYQKMEKTSDVLGYVPWIGAGVMFAVSGSLLKSFVLVTLLGPVMPLPGIVLGHMGRSKIRKNESPSINRGRSSVGLILNYLGVLTSVPFFVWVPFGDPTHGRASNEASAIGSLRSIQRAAEAYKSKHADVGFPEKLAELSFFPGDAETDAKIDPLIAGGEKSGYRFTYVPKKEADGRIESYEAFADPSREGVTGAQHFFVNPSEIRYAVKGSANDQSALLQ